MTYREKLKLEHPDKIDPTACGGCKGCPNHYWPNASIGCANGVYNCTECWDREIPETTYFGVIEFCDGRSVRITKYEIRENSTDCLIVNFKSENGGWYTFKKDRKTGETWFVQAFYSCVFNCDIKKAFISDPTRHTLISMAKDEPSLYPKIPISKELEQYIKYDTGMVVKALNCVRQEWEAKLNAEKKRTKLPQIKNVIFNNPATIVFWDDGSKTVVKANGDDAFVPEVGLAMAISKKALGNGSSYFDEFKKWCKDENNNLITKDKHTQMKIDAAISVLEKVLIYANKPLKKDLEAAIDTALCHLTDISDSYRIYYPKEGLICY